MSGLEPGRFEPGSGEVSEPGRIGGVMGSGVDGGAAVVSMDVLALASPDIVPVVMGMVAEVSTDAPVEALAAAFQSLLARILGEAFE